MDESNKPQEPAAPETVDVVVMGGALSGAATALLLKRKRPKLRVVLIERSETFSRRVGESTVEVSSYFLTRVLGLTEYLNQEHLNKQGLRFWFQGKAPHCPSRCSEVGPGYNVRIPSYQVDRARLDEEILRRAVEAGVEVRRPAVVKSAELREGSISEVTFTESGQTFSLSTRWLVDATGVVKFLARKNGWVVANDAHPISSIWSRWTGVTSLDSMELREKMPNIAGRGVGTRFTATNHIVGDGWWSWWIALKGGDTSVGVVFDERLTALPKGGSLADRLRAMLEQHPMGKELLQNATPDEADMHYRKRLPYMSKRVIGNGFALVGDAAGFMDPFYSPGMDWISFGVCSTVNLILRERSGRNVEALSMQLNEEFITSYRRWFEAIYQDKYQYMGDYELMLLSFRLDLGLYYLGVVSQPYKRGWKGLLHPAFSEPASRLPFLLIRAYNRRLAAIACNRRKRGTWGRKNVDHAFMFNSYTLDWKLPVRLVVALMAWAALEVREGWRTWFRSKEPAAVLDFPNESGLPNATQRTGSLP